MMIKLRRLVDELTMMLHVDSQQLTGNVNVVGQTTVADLFATTHAVHAKGVHDVGYYTHSSMYAVLPYNIESITSLVLDQS